MTELQTSASSARGGRKLNASPEAVRFTGAGALNLRASRYGEETAPPVLLLHGGGQTRHAWRDTAVALATAGYCAFTLDARGHGESDWCPEGDYCAETLAKDLGAVVRSLPAELIIVGASMGGLSAMLALGEDPALNCTALVLVDVAPRLEHQGVHRVIEFMRCHQDGFETLEQVRNTIASYNPHRPRPKDLSGLRKNLRQREDGRFYWHWDPAFLNHAKVSAKDEGMFERARLERAARRLKMPVLLIRGYHSDVLSEQGARELLDLVPHARYLVLSQAGHMVAGDRNNVFTKAVLDFLRDPSRTGELPDSLPLCQSEAKP